MTEKQDSVNYIHQNLKKEKVVKDCAKAFLFPKQLEAKKLKKLKRGETYEVRIF